MDLNTFRVKKKELDEEIAKHGKEALVKGFQEFFQQYPEVRAVRWTQYTPYFNDGDPCEFARHDFEISLDFIQSLTGSSDYDGDDFFDDWDEKVKNNAKLKEAFQFLGKTFVDTDDIFLASFGDGSEVTATIDGFSVETYDHE